MNPLSSVLNEEKLLTLNFDSNPISSVLNEILILFKDQQKRITRLENSLQDKLDFPIFENFSKQFDQLNKECGIEFQETHQQLADIKKELRTTVTENKEQQEIEKLEVLAETRRLITTEIKQVSYSDEISSMNKRIKSAEDMLDKLADAIENGDFSSTGNTGVQGEGVSTMKLTRLQHDIDDLKTKLESYTNLEANVNEIMINHPLQMKKLEKKVNELSNAINNNDLGEYPTNPFITGNNFSGLRPGAYPPNQPPPEMVDLEEFPQKPRIFHVDEKVIEAAMDDENEGKSETEPTENTQQENPQQSSKDDYLGRPGLKTKSSTPRQHIFQHSPHAHDSSEIHGHQNDEKVIKVIENKTYKTEMNSSVRVVSELEWLNGLIQKHHDAIRALQQNVRTQQENFDTIVENLTKVNSTNNSRISQIAQQMNGVKTDNEVLQRKFNEQTSKIYSMISDVNSQIDPQGKNLVQYEQDSNSESIESNRGFNSSRIRNFKEMVNLDGDEDADNENGNENSTELSDNPQNDSDIEQHESNENIDNGRKPYKKKNFLQLDEIQRNQAHEAHHNNNQSKKPYQLCFRLIHLNITPSSTYMTSVIKVQGEPVKRNRLGRIELFDTPGYGGQNQPQLSSRSIISGRKNATDEDNANNGTDNDNLNIPDVQAASSRSLTKNVPPSQLLPNDYMLISSAKNATSEPPPTTSDPMNGMNADDFLSLGKMPRKEIFHETYYGEIPSEAIEEKVALYARRIVSILVDNAKKDFKEEQLNLQKTVDVFVAQIDNKIDREFVERMFNKFRIAMNELNEKVENLQCSFLEWVTRDELEMVLQNFVKVVSDVKDTAASKSKYNCLLCGRPRQHLAGMMIGGTKMGGPTSNSLDVNNQKNVITRPVVPVPKL